MNHKTIISRSKTRRQFLKSGFLATGGAVLGFPAVVSSKSPNGKLNTVVIACGGRGAANLKEIGGLTNVVALCDVNSQALDAAAQQYPNARKYRDFRELYAKEMDYDAAVISTAEHTHAFAVLPALRAKKHVYCEKPLTRDVHEARVVMAAAKE
ncbi:Gfo/Idh/MocA family oxidoreductase, partial [Verrucomicrobium sp. BvORR106]|uniref:Gfo/Idh/MocA family protein n=1 Tax=Verrucomicrobium sp. BvORR106 TaxID=1403819 RepID=UPI0005716FAA